MKNESIFAAMKAQLTPSQGAQTALLEALSAPADQFEGGMEGKSTPKRGFARRYLALAACAALVLCTWSVQRLSTGRSPRLHSYVTVGEGGRPQKGDYQTALAELSGDREAENVTTVAGQGDHDVAMSPGALRENMESVGFSPEDVDAYLAAGHHMTWALWHAYNRRDGGEADLADFLAYTAENQARIDEIIDAYGLDEEDGINTGDLPGGAYMGDLPVQEGAEAYARLMDRFQAEYGEGAYPDWYGGAYLDNSGVLVVVLSGDDPGDKSSELQVIDWAESDRVVFTDGKYSYAKLLELNSQLLELLQNAGVAGGFGIYDDRNCIVLEVGEPPSDDLLAALAELDPDDDAILIQVTGGRVVYEPTEGIAPIGDREAPSHSGSAGEEDPAPYFADPGGVPAPDEDLQAIEPDYDGGISDLPGQLPQSKGPAQTQRQPLSEPREEGKPAEYDLLPLEE